MVQLSQVNVPVALKNQKLQIKPYSYAWVISNIGKISKTFKLLVKAIIAHIMNTLLQTQSADSTVVAIIELLCLTVQVINTATIKIITYHAL